MAIINLRNVFQAYYFNKNEDEILKVQYNLMGGKKNYISLIHEQREVAYGKSTKNK